MNPLEPLAVSIPLVPLGRFPTPVHRLDRIAQALGLAELWIKRDDISAESYGGNKVRKLELLLGAVLARERKAILTTGALGSHHVLACAVHGQRLGLEVGAVVFPRPVDAAVIDNTRAAVGAGARLLPVPHPVAVPAAAALDCALTRPSPDWIPAGGSSTIGTLGYVTAALELRAQVDAGLLPAPERLYVALGSGGTMAGLVLGCRLAGFATRVVGVRVVPAVVANHATVAALANAALLRLIGAGLRHGLRPVRPWDFDVVYDQAGKGYGRPTPEGTLARARLQALEALPLDDTYTAKTFAGLLGHVSARPELRDRPLLFWHTYSTLPMQPLLSAAPQVEQLSPALRRALRR